MPFKETPPFPNTKPFSIQKQHLQMRKDLSYMRWPRSKLHLIPRNKTTHSP